MSFRQHRSFERRRCPVQKVKRTPWLRCSKSENDSTEAFSLRYWALHNSVSAFTIRWRLANLARFISGRVLWVRMIEKGLGWDIDK